MLFDLYTQTGKKKGTLEASDAIFGMEPNAYLIARAFKRQHDNSRQGTAHTKTRGEVAYSTKKIYAQKHTGRARHGARSSNLFRKGGVVFGPRYGRNWKTLMPRKHRRLALFSALSTKAKENAIFCLASYEGEIKTKPFITMMQQLPPLKESKRLLIITAEKNPLIEKSSRNIRDVKIITASYLNIADILKYDHLMFLADAVKKTEEVFLKEKLEARI
jgi:large subunit ribosomal protein L4